MDLTIKATSPWLEGLPFDWSRLDPFGTLLSLEKHEYVYHYEDDADHVYIVKNGRVRLFLTSHDGREKAIAIVGVNGLLGECSIRPKHYYLTSAITAAPTTLLKIHNKVFEEVVLIEPDLSKQWIEMLSLKLALITHTSLQLSFGSSLRRLCETFIHLARTYGRQEKDGSFVITITFTHQELADLIGTTRVTVVNSIKELFAEGLLLKPDRYYQIPNIDTLMTYTQKQTV